ncbi:MAG: hypothetical protein R2991_00820 [Thermoanaerobaculia bacterium]
MDVEHRGSMHCGRALLIASQLLVASHGAAVEARKAPGDPVALFVDDGSVEDVYVQSLAFTVLVNRFTPAEFPLELERVDVLFPPGKGGPPVGWPIHVYLYADPDGDLLNGTEARLEAEGTVQSVDGVTFSEIEFPPVRFDGPGDILVGVSVGGGVPAWGASDLTVPQQRSWEMIYSPVEAAEGIPVIPADQNVLHTDRNWLIRAFGTVVDVPVELQSVAVD